MLTTIKNYTDFLTDSFNSVKDDPTNSVIYKYAYLRLQHDLETFKEHNGMINVPEPFFTLFLDWWSNKNQTERKMEIN